MDAHTTSDPLFRERLGLQDRLAGSIAHKSRRFGFSSTMGEIKPIGECRLSQSIQIYRSRTIFRFRTREHSMSAWCTSKGKPRDLDYPACWTGARRCGAEIWRAALSASPPKCKNGCTAGIEPPQTSLLRVMRICVPIRSPISLLPMQQHPIWIWSLRDFVFKKRRSPASADELRMLRMHRRGVSMLSSGPRG